MNERRQFLTHSRILLDNRPTAMSIPLRLSILKFYCILHNTHQVPGPHLWLRPPQLLQQRRADTR